MSVMVLRVLLVYFCILTSLSVDFFFLSKNEKKLSSKVSALKVDLDLLRAEMEAEHQTYQEEEKSLHARVVETKK